MRVLVVEDEPRVASFTRNGLREAGYVSDLASKAEVADELVSSNDYDLILLDWLLPDGSGVELCQRWRKERVMTPIIMLTCKDKTEDIIKALDGGADDYLVKPFSLMELLARIRALLRRASVGSGQSQIEVDDLTLDLSRREVYRGGSKIDLSYREYCLLEYLLRNAGRTVSRSEISERVWGNHFDTNTNVIEVYVNHLRKKLDCGSKRPLIKTIRGFGYMIQGYDS